METLWWLISGVFGIVSLLCILIGIFSLFRLQLLTVICCVVMFLVTGFITSCANDWSKTPEERAAIKAELEAKDQADKAAKEQENIEKAATLTGEDKELYDTKFQKYKATLSDSEARAKALEDVDSAIEAKKAAEKAAKKAEEAEKKAAEEAQSPENLLANGWDKSFTYSSATNIQKATELIGKHSDFIKNQTATTAQPMHVVRSPYVWYGKVVTFTGTVKAAKESAPDENITKAFGGKHTEGILMCEDIPILFHVNTDAKHVPIDSEVTIKGFVVGSNQAESVIAFIGLVETNPIKELLLKL